MTLEPGRQIGPYVVEARIGAGGMGVVYRVRDTRLDRVVALKVLTDARISDDDSKRRFLQEARAASALNHPNIVTIYEVGATDGIDYLAMEFIEGKPLERVIPRGGMPIGEALGCASQIADALAKAHQAGIVHRDLKPANVMIAADGLVKILDFGLAKVSSSAAAVGGLTRSMSLTGEGAVIGTAYYMSPEQAESKPVDSRSDIFSFGVMLYEMATGRRPFTGQSDVAVLSAILRETPKPLAGERPGIPPELDRVVARCLRKDPARRFQHMADLKVALVELKEEWDSGALLPPLDLRRKPTRKSRLWLRVGLAAALLAAAAIGWRFVLPQQPSEDTAIHPVPLTSYAGLEEDPSFSPDGNQVAFSWNGEKEDNFDIYVKLVGPGSPLRLTTDSAEDRFPRWSPDGRSIAFIRQPVSADDRFSVFVVPPLGGPERRIGEFSNHGSRWLIDQPSLCWTLDSKALIVSASASSASSASAPNQLFLVPLDGGPSKQLTDPKHGMYGDTRPVLSQDGARLAFIRENDSVFGVYVQAMSSAMEPVGAPAEIPLPEKLVTGIEWIPGGRELLFAVGLTSSSTLFRVGAKPGAAPRILAGSAPGSIDPTVSRDGRRMAYVAETVDSNLWSVDLATKTPALARPLSSSFSDLFPQYSPDGTRVLFYSYRSGSAQIWVANRDGTQLQQLTSFTGTVTASPRWSPDGKQVVFDSNTGGEFQVYVMSSDGGRARLLTGDKPAWAANWSRDGRSIYFACSRGGAYQVCRSPVEGGAIDLITHGGGVWPSESPDGKMLYFTKETGPRGLWRMPVNGGRETQVAPDVYRANYVLTDDGVYFIPALGESRTTSIQFLNFATGARTEILKIPEPVDDGLTVSPDRRTLIYSQIDRLGRDLMLVEGFR
jgi:Tol biopolymer transport system component/tRNA A-37 threonylcarbamoyl transferase component Bud32